MVSEMNPDFLERTGRSIPVSTYVEAPVYEMLHTAAQLEELSMAKWIRKIIIERLRDEGFTPEGVEV